MNHYFECEICGKLYKTEQEVTVCENKCGYDKLKEKEFLANKEKIAEEIASTRRKLRELEEKFRKEFEPPSVDLTEYYKILSDFYRAL